MCLLQESKKAMDAFLFWQLSNLLMITTTIHVEDTYKCVII